jgi:hypothetical protein
MVPKRGLEPPLPDGNYTLNVARLPIPPLRHRVVDIDPASRPTDGNYGLKAIPNLAIRPRVCQAGPVGVAGCTSLTALAAVVKMRSSIRFQER